MENDIIKNIHKLWLFWCLSHRISLYIKSIFKGNEIDTEEYLINLNVVNDACINSKLFRKILGIKEAEYEECKLRAFSSLIDIRWQYLVDSLERLILNYKIVTGAVDDVISKKIKVDGGLYNKIERIRDIIYCSMFWIISCICMCFLYIIYIYIQYIQYILQYIYII